MGARPSRLAPGFSCFRGQAPAQQQQQQQQQQRTGGYTNGLEPRDGQSTSSQDGYGTLNLLSSSDEMLPSPSSEETLPSPPSDETPPQQGGYKTADRGAYEPSPPRAAMLSPPRAGRTSKLAVDFPITDDTQSLDLVVELAKAGLKSSKLILGFDFTKSNDWTGKFSFDGRSLHHLGVGPNHYEQVVSIIGPIMSKFDEDNLIPCFGFGDASTHDQDIFCFSADGSPCIGFSGAVQRYRELVPDLCLAGPTSFAPIIEMAMTIVGQSGGQHHTLFIIADGQVTSAYSTSGQLSSQEQKTVDAIVKASEFPLSIVLVGVGDGPWNTMEEFAENIPTRAFDNFEFVNFSGIMSKNLPWPKKKELFALKSMMKIPEQYEATVELGILGCGSYPRSPNRIPLPPPSTNDAYSESDDSIPRRAFDLDNLHPLNSFKKSQKKKSSRRATFGFATLLRRSQRKKNHLPAPVFDSTPNSDESKGSRICLECGVASHYNQGCPICREKPLDMAFGCGHQTCCDCGQALETCPICRTSIVTRIRLY